MHVTTKPRISIEAKITRANGVFERANGSVRRGRSRYNRKHKEDRNGFDSGHYSNPRQPRRLDC